MQTHTCCNKHHKHLNDLKKRSVALLFLGCLSLIPYVEAILTSGSVFGLLFFVVSFHERHLNFSRVFIYDVKEIVISSNYLFILIDKIANQETLF